MRNGSAPAESPVFVDRSGIRRRWFVILGVAGAGALTLAVLVLVAGFFGAGFASGSGTAASCLMPNASAMALLMRGGFDCAAAAFFSILRAGASSSFSSGNSLPGREVLPSSEASAFSVSWPRRRSSAVRVNGPQVRPCSVRIQ